MSDDLLGYVDTHFGKASTTRLSEVSKISIGGLARPFSESQSSIVQQIGKIAVPTSGITGLGKVVSASQSSIAQQMVEQNSGVNTQHGVKEQLNNEEDKYTK